MKIDKKLKQNVEKYFKQFQGEVRFVEDIVEESGLPVAIIKLNIKGTIGIRKVKRLAVPAFKKLKKSIAYIFIHDVKDEEVAIVASDGEWCCVN
jgi:hypothetical protein